ncbi:hypothetical protein [Streptomyces mirabilis]|uniref:hypothetical protein n=1 Tax=Streptomyces mirabilis TaxID=68239 RepID=UPI0033EEA4FB
MLEDPKALEYEENIVLTEDVEGFDYVRQSVAQSALSEAVDPGLSLRECGARSLSEHGERRSTKSRGRGIMPISLDVVWTA